MSIFNIYLPVAGMEFSALMLILIGFCVGVIAGFFGEGGGWFVTPALNIFGFHMAYAIGTCLANIFGQSIGAVAKHHRMGNIDWKLGGIAIAVSIMGFAAGSLVVMRLENSGNAGEIIRWCYVIFLFGLSAFMFYDYSKFQKRNMKGRTSDDASSLPDVWQERAPLAARLYKIRLRPMISFPASGIESVSLWIIIAIFLFTGFFSGLLGIGGGFIIMPTLIYLIGLPTVLAVGTSLITVLCSSGFGCLIYGIHGRIEVVAAVILLIGASAGAQIGANAVRYIKGYGIRVLFATMISCAGLSVVLEQAFKLTGIPVFQESAEIDLVGIAVVMTTIIISKLVIESRKERRTGLVHNR